MRFSGNRTKRNTFSGIKAYGTPNAFTPYSISKSNTQNNVEALGPTGPVGVGIESIYNVENGIIINLTNGISDFIDL